jgi:hypothetical protein
MSYAFISKRQPGKPLPGDAIFTHKLFEYDGTAQAARFIRSEATLDRAKRITKPGDEKLGLGISEQT